MALKAYPLNDTDYAAEDAQLYTATRTSGVYADNHFNISVTGAISIRAPARGATGSGTGAVAPGYISIRAPARAMSLR